MEHDIPEWVVKSQIMENRIQRRYEVLTGGLLTGERYARVRHRLPLEGMRCLPTNLIVQAPDPRLRKTLPLSSNAFSMTLESCRIEKAKRSWRKGLLRPLESAAGQDGKFE